LATGASLSDAGAFSLDVKAGIRLVTSQANPPEQGVG
jgi:hypothetical protein